jgi:hypothetical protein
MGYCGDYDGLGAHPGKALTSEFFAGNCLALFNHLGKFCHSENQLEKIIDT